ncbi:MAG: A/G-specific adenine glycosylase [Lentimicrobiaceae bacterium]|nr:A/G-specific adenine glycosylase [Lentimicrobiaceae bacterium]
MKKFSQTLFGWYRQNKRELPWRDEQDPYKIWVSEIILQQTRIAQGWDYYLRFVERFPSVSHLATASEDEVLKYWQGLGYYSRARNLHAGAKYIMETHKGVFPDNQADILKIKGVGDYTAAAISSFAFQLPFPAIDGNVFRVLTRIFGIATPIDTAAGKKEITKLATQLIDSERPGTFNQALMDFGALQCTPALPKCEDCCFAFSCVAKKQNLTASLPVKSLKISIKTRYFYYLRILEKEKTYICKRSAKDIWQGLYEFPLIESGENLSQEEVLSHSYTVGLLKNCQWTIEQISPVHKHQLTHQTIIGQCFTIKIRKGSPLVEDNIFSIAEKDFPLYPVSRLMERLISQLV